MSNFKEKLTFKLILQIIISLIGLIGTLLGIYSYWFEDKKVRVEYEILANTNVLDINANLTKLDIIYDGNSLKINNKSLQIINVRIKNIGNESILKSFYDEDDPLGTYISKGKIIEKPELISSSNDYIRKNLKIKYDSLGNITFNDIILEPKEYFTLKLLVLHKNGEIPELHSKGKIAGIKNIPVISFAQQAKEEKSFWAITFGGDIFTQILRALSYTLIVIIIVLLSAISYDSLSEFKKKQKRIRIIREFKKHKEYDYSKMDDAIFTKFQETGLRYLLNVQNLISDESRLNRKYVNGLDNLKQVIEPEIEGGTISSKEFILNDTIFSPRNEWKSINQLINDGYAIKDNHQLIINQQMKRSLGLFIDYLKETKYFSPEEIKIQGHSMKTELWQGIIIHSAKYKYENNYIDVKNKINELIANNELEFKVTNELMGGDPASGQRKTLEIEYTIEGKKKRSTVLEGVIMKFQ